MKTLVLGASGATGKLVVSQLLERSISARIVIRESATIPDKIAEDKNIEIGVTRYTTNPDGKSCEMAVVVRDDYQHQGVASALLASLIQHAKAKGLRKMEGEVLSENSPMIDLVKKHNFSVKPTQDDPTVLQIELNLDLA